MGERFSPPPMSEAKPDQTATSAKPEAKGRTSIEMGGGIDWGSIARAGEGENDDNSVIDRLTPPDAMF